MLTALLPAITAAQPGEKSAPQAQCMIGAANIEWESDGSNLQ